MNAYDRINLATDELERFGYWVHAKPSEGHEMLFADHLEQAVKNVARMIEGLRKAHGYRHGSKPLLAHLHKCLPEPEWGIKVKL